MNARALRLALPLAAILGMAPSTLPAAEAVHVPTPVVRTLANGLTVAVFPDDRLPMVQIQLLVAAGSVHEPPGAAGVANLTFQMLSQGTASRSPAVYVAAVEALGGSVGGATSREFTTVNGSFIATDFEAGLELLADAVVHPVLSEDRLALVKDQAAAVLTRARQDAGTLADDHLWATVFAGHPFGRSPQGALRGLPALGVAQVRAFHRERYRPDRTLLAIAGDVTPERAFRAAEDLLGPWGGRTAETAPAAPPTGTGWRVRIVDAPGLDRAELRLGVPGPARAAKDYDAMVVASDLLEQVDPGAGIHAGVFGLKDGGLFSIAAAAPVDSVGAEVARIRLALGGWTAGPAPERGLAAVRHRLLGGYPLQFETLDGVIAKWMAVAFNGLPDDAIATEPEHIAGLTAADVRAAAARWVPDGMVLVVLGPAERLKPQLASLGPVEVVTRGDVADVVEEPSTAMAPPAPEALSKGRAIAALAIAAHGGLARLRGIKDSNIDGDIRMTVGHEELKGQASQLRKDPMRFLFTMVFPGIRTVQGLEGDSAWSTSGLGGTEEAGDSVAVAGLQSGFRSDLLHLLLAAADSTSRVAWRGQERVDDRDADVIEVVASDGDRRVLCFDAVSHQMLAMEQNDAGHSARRLYRDLREVNGVLWPFSEERLLDGQRTMTFTLRHVAFNTGVKNEVFRRPKHPAPPKARPR
ncbi:MAG: insulinase family protein [Candidatus Eisenbacteria bacterium]|uniref:Insulinase family protein n=1 Tax=Eiseniibacteriota bacterium TaxID=2212470 RepID=A0A538U5C4_UNCEI|nr:MAG: insulinase family protein [Candidatus Eisenbacteria bacterium]